MWLWLLCGCEYLYVTQCSMHIIYVPYEHVWRARGHISVCLQLCGRTLLRALWTDFSEICIPLRSTQPRRTISSKTDIQHSVRVAAVAQALHDISRTKATSNGTCIYSVLCHFSTSSELTNWFFNNNKKYNINTYICRNGNHSINFDHKKAHIYIPTHESFPIISRVQKLKRDHEWKMKIFNSFLPDCVLSSVDLFHWRNGIWPSLKTHRDMPLLYWRAQQTG